MFGPPGGITRPSTWPCVVHVDSRLLPPTSRPFKTRFRFGFTAKRLNLADNSNSPDHYAKGTPSGIPPCGGIALRPLVGMWFQVQCPPLVGVLPIFRSRYFSTIGRQRVLSLTGWTPQIRAHLHVLGVTQVPNRPLSPAAYGTITLCGSTFQKYSARVLAF